MTRHIYIFLLLLLSFFVLANGPIFAHDQHLPPAKYQVPETPVRIGQPPFEYELVPGWGSANTNKLPNCHAIVSLHYSLVLLVDDPKACIVEMDLAGRVTRRWGDFTRSAHGLTVDYNQKENEFTYYITDNAPGGAVYITKQDGTLLQTITCPQAAIDKGLYQNKKQFRPSKTILLPNGFLIVDGYGKDYIHRYNDDGEYQFSIGGNLGEGEAKLKHWGPHGGLYRSRGFFKKGDLLLALSDQQKIKRFTAAGRWLETIPLPGGNPRDIEFNREHYWVPHLGDNWPKDRNAAGFISVLDKDLTVVANLGGEPPVYKDGKLQPMRHNTHVFHHPHGMTFDWMGNLYVAQFASGGTWPLKFRPVPTKPPEVRFVYMVSKDREEKPEYTAAIKRAAKQVQGWLKEKAGATFEIAEPIVDVVKSPESAMWFTESPVPFVPKPSWGFMNTYNELQRIKGDDFHVPWETVWVVYSDGPGNSGRAFPGFVYLPEDDLLGLVGKHPTQKDPDRWDGGLMHELGHGLGLVHPIDTNTYRDAIMWAGFYGKYPDNGAYLTEEDLGILKDSPFLYPPKK